MSLKPPEFGQKTPLATEKPKRQVPAPSREAWSNEEIPQATLGSLVDTTASVDISPTKNPKAEAKDKSFNIYSVSAETALRTGPTSSDDQTEEGILEWTSEVNMKVAHDKKMKPVRRGNYLFFLVRRISPIPDSVKGASRVYSTFWIAKEWDPKAKKYLPGWARSIRP